MDKVTDDLYEEFQTLSDLSNEPLQRTTSKEMSDKKYQKLKKIIDDKFGPDIEHSDTLPINPLSFGSIYPKIEPAVLLSQNPRLTIPFVDESTLSKVEPVGSLKRNPRRTSSFAAGASLLDIEQKRLTNKKLNSAPPKHLAKRKLIQRPITTFPTSISMSDIPDILDESEESDINVPKRSYIPDILDESEESDINVPKMSYKFGETYVNKRPFDDEDKLEVNEVAANNTYVDKLEIDKVAADYAYRRFQYNKLFGVDRIINFYKKVAGIEYDIEDAKLHHEYYNNQIDGVGGWYASFIEEHGRVPEENEISRPFRNKPKPFWIDTYAAKINKLNRRLS